MRDLTAPDSVEEEYATRRTHHGVDEIVEGAEGWKRAFPDAKGIVTGAYADGPKAIIELRWEGTNTGPMTTPTGEQVPPTGRQVSVCACQVMEIENGKVKSNHHYFDLATLLDQLGIGAPAEAGAGVA
jgi:predicted ester cyclase